MAYNENAIRMGQAFNLAEFRRIAEKTTNDNRALYEHVIFYRELADFFQTYSIESLKKREKLVPPNATLSDLYAMLDGIAEDKDGNKSAKGAAYNLAVHRTLADGNPDDLKAIYSHYVELLTCSEVITNSTVADLKEALR